MTSQTVPRPRHAKEVGEEAELKFLLKAIQEGLTVSKPWGDSLKYDAVTDNGTDRLSRVQVKASAFFDKKNKCFVVGLASGSVKRRTGYTALSIDFVAAHIFPLNLWYILPVSKLTKGTTLRIYPDRPSPYKEAWHLLK